MHRHFKNPPYHLEKNEIYCKIENMKNQLTSTEKHEPKNKPRLVDADAMRAKNTGAGFAAHVVLVEPEIPQNTGNIARTCAALGCPLHLVEPLGFSLEDKYMRRAGLDYWHMLDVHRYPDLETFFEKNNEGDFALLSRKGTHGYHEIPFTKTTYFLFGKETYGLPDELIEKYREQCFRIPMRKDSRSLNLSNTVAIVMYEAYRQNGFPGLTI